MDRVMDWDEDDAERAVLQRRIGDAGWHILRDEQVADGYVVEYQRAPAASFVVGAETRTSRGTDRNDAYRRFLEDLAAENPAAEA